MVRVTDPIIFKCMICHSRVGATDPHRQVVAAVSDTWVTAPFENEPAFSQRMRARVARVKAK